MSDIPYLGPWFGAGGVLAWIAAVAAVTGTIAAIATIAGGDRWPGNRAAAIAVGAVPAALLVVAGLASVAIVERARHRIIAGIPGGPMVAVDTFVQWMADAESQLLLAGLLVVGVPLAAGALVRSLRTTGWPVPALAAAIAAIAVVTGLGLAAAAWPLVWDWSSFGILRGTAAAWERTQQARLGVLATALAAAVLAGAAAVVLGRRRQVAGTGSWTAAVAVALLGALAWWGTRARAHDAANPLSSSRDGVVAWPLSARVPEVATCGELSAAPVLEIDARAPGEAVLDGRRLDGAMLAQDLETLRRNWRMLHPNRPFPGTLLIVADRSIRPAALVPWLEVAHRAEYRDARRVVIQRVVQRTATLHGRVVYRMCDVPLQTR